MICHECDTAWNEKKSGSECPSCKCDRLKTELIAMRELMARIGDIVIQAAEIKGKE